VGAQYQATLVVETGEPVTWSITSGRLPNGLQTLMPDAGTISGSPLETGAFTFTVSVSDNRFIFERRGQATYTINIGCPTYTISPATLQTGVEGRSYSQTLSVGAGASVRWSVSSGSLPGGLSLNVNSGAISGTPTQAGDFNFTVNVAHSTATDCTASQPYSLTVIPRLTVDANLPIGRVGEEYSHSFAPSGGVPPYTAQLVGLPAGLSFDQNTFAITGTPKAARVQPYTLQLTVTDSGDPNQALVKQLQLRIKPEPVQITTASLPDAQEDWAYSRQLTATGGITPYQWSIIAGVLPDGLSITNQQTGVISGIPSKAGTFTFTVQVKDSDSPTPGTDSRELSITVQ
jgi:hypothetical protein